jgi:translation elongation factor EF-1alpha
VLRKGDSLSFEDGTTAGVETIELHHNEVKKAEEGNVVGLGLSGIDASYITEGSRAKSEEGTDGDGSVR